MLQTKLPYQSQAAKGMFSPGVTIKYKLDHAQNILGWCRKDGVVVVVLLLLTEDLELQEELLLVEDLGIR